MWTQNVFDRISRWQEFCKITVLKKIQLHINASVMKSSCPLVLHRRATLLNKGNIAGAFLGTLQNIPEQIFSCTSRWLLDTNEDLKCLWGANLLWLWSEIQSDKEDFLLLKLATSKLTNE